MHAAGRFGSTVMAIDRNDDELAALLDNTSDLTLGTSRTFGGAPIAIMRRRRGSAAVNDGTPDSVVATLDSCDRQVAQQQQQRRHQQQSSGLGEGIGADGDSVGRSGGQSIALLDASARSAAAQQGQIELEKDLEQQRRRRQVSSRPQGSHG